MQVGIIGLPNAGKSTIFNALTRANAEVASYPFCTIEPNTGLISVPDKNISGLSRIYNSKKVTHAVIRILDIAGLVKGASRGEGLGNKFLSHIREVDVIAHIVRCFYDENVAHSPGKISPDSDIGIINTELLLADIETLQKKREKLSGTAKSGDLNAREQIKIIDFFIDEFNNASVPDIDEMQSHQHDFLKEIDLLSLKPALYIANMGDDESSEDLYSELKNKIKDREVIRIFGKLESELLEIPLEERPKYRRELGITGEGLNGFIKRCYSMLDLLTFYTINENETRAWSLKRGSSVLEASGKIHTDMQRGFIKAEVINCQELLRFGSIQKSRDEGKVRLEGKDYTVKDEDVIQVKFSA